MSCRAIEFGFGVGNRNVTTAHPKLHHGNFWCAVVRLRLRMKWG